MPAVRRKLRENDRVRSTDDAGGRQLSLNEVPFSSCQRFTCRIMDN